MDASSVRTSFEWDNQQKCEDALNVIYDKIRKSGSVGLTKITEENLTANPGVINYVWRHLTSGGFSIEPVTGCANIITVAYVVSWSLC